MPRPVVGEEWPTGVWGRQAPRAFSLEEAPVCGRGSSLSAVLPHSVAVNGGAGGVPEPQDNSHRAEIRRAVIVTLPLPAW
jgi:hypothetical protein